MRSNNSSLKLFRQHKKQQSRSLVKKATKQVVHLDAQEELLLALGQYGMAILNLIEAFTKKYGQCYLSFKSMAQLLGCHRDTVAVKIKALMQLGYLEQTTKAKFGYKRVTIKQVMHPHILKAMLMLFTMQITSIITCFSQIPTLLSYESYLKQKNMTAIFKLATFGGGVPPDILEHHDCCPQNNLKGKELHDLFAS